MENNYYIDQVTTNVIGKSVSIVEIAQFAIKMTKIAENPIIQPKSHQVLVTAWFAREMNFILRVFAKNAFANVMVVLQMKYCILRQKFE